jgi:hypothetical protein
MGLSPFFRELGIDAGGPLPFGLTSLAEREGQSPCLGDGQQEVHMLVTAGVASGSGVEREGRRRHLQRETIRQRGGRRRWSPQRMRDQIDVDDLPIDQRTSPAMAAAFLRRGRAREIARECPARVGPAASTKRSS